MHVMVLSLVPRNIQNQDGIVLLVVRRQRGVMPSSPLVECGPQEVTDHERRGRSKR